CDADSNGALSPLIPLTICIPRSHASVAPRYIEYHAAMHNIGGLGNRAPPRGMPRGDLTVGREDITRTRPGVQPGSKSGLGYVRTLSQHEELPLLRDHLLRLDSESRHDRFNGFLDDSFIERYAARCADDGTVIVAYIVDGVVRGAAELHPPEGDCLPE